MTIPTTFQAIIYDREQPRHHLCTLGHDEGKFEDAFIKGQEAERDRTCRPDSPEVSYKTPDATILEAITALPADLQTTKIEICHTTDSQINELPPQLEENCLLLRLKLRASSRPWKHPVTNTASPLQNQERQEYGS